MAAKARKASACPVSTGLAGADSVLAIGSGNNVVVNTTILFSNTAVPFITVGNNALSTANLMLRTASVPASSIANGVQGQVIWDSGFIYVCIATNSWKRATLATF